ncbi:MAG: hypothetical protein SF162_06395 [bacterium]|nr:hypothetical protein [bacterium]
MDQHYQKWGELAPRGLLLIGAGLSIIGQATILKGRRRSPLAWIVFGILGLVVFNAGVAIFGESIKHRTLYEHKLNL